MNSRLAALAVGVTAAALSLSACNLEVNAGSAGSTGPTAPAGQQADKPGARPGAKAPTRCLSTELSAAIRSSSESTEESQHGILSLTNKSRRTCVIPAGWAVLGYGTPGAYRNLNAGRRSVPGAAAPLTLRPGASAYTGTFWGTSPEPWCAQQMGGASAGLAVLWWGDWIRATGRIGAPCNGGALIGTFRGAPDLLTINP